MLFYMQMSKMVGFNKKFKRRKRFCSLDFSIGSRELKRIEPENLKIRLPTLSLGMGRCIPVFIRVL